MVENIQQKRLFRNQSRICSKNLVQVTNLRNSGVWTPLPKNLRNSSLRQTPQGVLAKFVKVIEETRMD
jgi:hypothetical protein